MRAGFPHAAIQPSAQTPGVPANPSLASIGPLPSAPPPYHLTMADVDPQQTLAQEVEAIQAQPAEEDPAAQPQPVAEPQQELEGAEGGDQPAGEAPSGAEEGQPGPPPVDAAAAAASAAALAAKFAAEAGAQPQAEYPVSRCAFLPRHHAHHAQCPHPPLCRPSPRI